ncbi:MAG: SemiSWEET transporter [Pseudanabaena sp.]|jgi:MtN3 and saliva related transmembrane protein|uniref:SemiSWEET transporter n=1 Tax=Pseudanabaena mucicola TaxID=71190 RepID=UPI000E7DDB28|nr:SemiSWEET transporter [Pseudanabaena mucicola]MCA6574543.1 SemiSWEET transporter [Pseudanabaena sp. M53BS1SP1A06MG]MCA6582344.1 SemiSWEET transporter [Pseudanabaena sp. M34BS1SP1A06MG]MCA6585073.1 SemiSWEET transporter [Pseudanabaena sp. M051S1SP1A06QC]MCA6589480.1 SemiSWEET transporter [Pseudanabaena sp. M109S1SP1A06QC]MCA6592246.1 SemiSWEET transporter [Pseudanabaena sp. M38BS1SP1A06MG]MCA6597201.1 SemiSWEET transporter [Pseudanabaena sp. M046S1SP1A06QC]MCA6599347.1 SemiSWEET transporte
MNFINILGFTAATLTTLAFLPQVIQVWRSRSTKDISLPMLITFIAGITLWLVYGLLVKAEPIYIANGVTLVLNLTILRFKLKYG